MAGDHHSSDKIDDFLQDVGITEDKSSGPKGKFFHKLQQKRVLMQAARKELVPGIALMVASSGLCIRMYFSCGHKRQVLLLALKEGRSSTWKWCRQAGSPRPWGTRYSRPAWCAFASLSTWSLFCGFCIWTSSPAHRLPHISSRAWAWAIYIESVPLEVTTRECDNLLLFAMSRIIICIICTSLSSGMYLKYCIGQKSRGGKDSLCHIKQHHLSVSTQYCSCLQLC